MTSSIRPNVGSERHEAVTGRKSACKEWWERTGLPEHEGIRWSQGLQQGDVIDQILRTAEDQHADLVVMASDGRSGIMDAFRGSHSEQIVRLVPCPVLVVPITAHEMPLLLS